MSLPPPPQRGRRAPPALVDDAIREIFMRVPPDDPKSLVRTAAVCPNWRGILSDAAFARDYRAFHRAPPMLGFLHNTSYRTYAGHWSSYTHKKQENWISHFVSTASSCPRSCEDRQDWKVVDSRHGFILFYTPKERLVDFLICDLVTNRQWDVQADEKFSSIIPRDEPKFWYEDEDDEDEDDFDEGLSWNAAVLCAKDQCDHLDCHDCPFLVAFVGSNDMHKRTVASVYSSETGMWSDIITIEQPDAIEAKGHSAVVRNKVYFPCENNRILEYNMGEKVLSVICLPFQLRPNIHHVLMGAEDGMMLFGTIMKHGLYLWSMEVAPNGAVEWAQKRVIKLKPLLPSSALSGVSVVGFAEGAGVIFLNTWRDGLFTVELSSGRSKKVHEKAVEKVFPYRSFYTGGRGWHSGGAPHEAPSTKYKVLEFKLKPHRMMFCQEEDLVPDREEPGVDSFQKQEAQESSEEIQD